jgi:hypothetical protein
MPAMPEGLDIDHSKPLNGTMAAYAEQVLICTGKEDWVSKIEDENDGDNLAADLKELLGRGGIYSDACLFTTPLAQSHPFCFRIITDMIFAAIPQYIHHQCLLPAFPTCPLRNPDHISLPLPKF